MSKIDPALTAIIEFVNAMCDIAVAEACGFHTGVAVEIRRSEAREKFVKAMEKLDES